MTQRSMAELASEIVKNNQAAADAQLIAAAAAAEAKRRYMEGETCGVETWAHWVIANTGLSLRRVDELAKIGSAESPETAMREYRQRGKARMKKTRQRSQLLAARAASHKKRLEIPPLAPRGLPADTDRQSHDYVRLCTAWDNACAEAREEFLEQIFKTVPDQTRIRVLRAMGQGPQVVAA